MSALRGAQDQVGPGRRGQSQQTRAQQTPDVEPLPAPSPAPSIASAADEAHVLSVVKGAGSSFYGAMRTLPKAQRDAMFAIYAFCREIDDIADEPAPEADILSIFWSKTSKMKGFTQKFHIIIIFDW